MIFVNRVFDFIFIACFFSAKRADEVLTEREIWEEEREICEEEQECK